MSNRTAILTEAKAHPLKVDDFLMPVAGSHQMIVKNHAAAFNPADAIVQTAGVLITNYPAILGEDLAGEVVSVGPDVTRFKVGDRIVAMASDIKFGTDAPYLGAFQLFCRVEDNFAAKIPDNVTYTEACVLPLGLCTAAASTSMKENMALPYPQLDPTPNGTVVLIWGASSSVGSCAVQIALAGGCEVATTSSAHNLEYCRNLGAAHVFDYKSGTIVDDVVNQLKSKQSAGVFCCVQDPESLRNCARIASKLGGRKFVATVIPPLPQFSMPDGLPEDVTMGWCRSISLYMHGDG
jgi:NADPH:quinone reductase-like Zn-dependent oxidoreductase